MKAPLLFVFFLEGLSLQTKQRSAPPKKPRACLSQAPTKRGVCASVPAALYLSLEEARFNSCTHLQKVAGQEEEQRATRENMTPPLQLPIP